MNIRTQLLKAHSRANADLIEAHAIANEEALVELMVCFLSEEKTVAQRAAMVVGNLGRSQPSFLNPWWNELVEVIENPIHPALRRNATRYFSELKIKLPKVLEAKLVKQCVSLVEDPKQDVAIAVFAMQVIGDRAHRYPEQAAQLREILHSQLDHASAGFRSRARKVLKQLEAVS